MQTLSNRINQDGPLTSDTGLLQGSRRDAKLGDHRVDGGLDQDVSLRDGMLQAQALRLQQHARADAERLPEVVTMVDPSVTVVSHDRMPSVEQMPLDLVKAPGLGARLDE